MNQHVEKNLYNINRILSVYLGLGKDMTKEQLLAMSESLRIMGTTEPSGNMSTAADNALCSGCFTVSGMR